MTDLIASELAKAGASSGLSPLLLELEKNRITSQKALPPMEFLFSLFDEPCFPRRELVAFTGRAKSGKTFVMSMLMVLCVARQVLAFKRNPPPTSHLSHLRVLWYDTEQSDNSTQDILVNMSKKSIPDKARMIIARVSVIVIALIAVFFARDPESSVFRIVSFAWAGFGAAFGPVMLFGLFWKRMTKWGALAGMVSGGAMIFLWKFVIAKAGGVFAIYELLPAFIVACIFIVVVSLATKKPDDSITDVFDSIQAEIKG